MKHGGIITAEACGRRDCLCHGKQKSNWERDQAQPYRTHPQWLTSSSKTLLSKVAKGPQNSTSSWGIKHSADTPVEASSYSNHNSCVGLQLLAQVWPYTLSPTLKTTFLVGLLCCRENTSCPQRVRKWMWKQSEDMTRRRRAWQGAGLLTKGPQLCTAPSQHPCFRTVITGAYSKMLK